MKIESSPILMLFYREYDAWLEGHCSFEFLGKAGLCHNLSLWCWARSEYGYVDRQQLETEMLRQFEEAGLSIAYPFNRTVTDYYVESRLGESHLNKERRKWVKTRVADGVVYAE